MLTFKTKSETLEELSKIIKKAKILPQARFSVEEWENNRQKVLEKVKINDWFDIPVIVRSSAINEDTKNESMAGKFLSVDNVIGEKSLEKAIEDVIKAFTDDNKQNQFFIQPMLNDVSVCGVAFTCDPNTNGNYYVINYDDSTGSTSSITSGNSMNGKVFYCFKGEIKKHGDFLDKLIEALIELEGLFNQNNLDVEFAVDKDGQVYIFQVRPLVIKGQIVSIKKQKRIIERIKNKINMANSTKPYLFGESTIFGVMPDWNPAEIIGTHPRPLALSLYKEVITDNVWAYQRDNYGYLNLRSFPLLIDFAGLPYVDVRVSFNSFIPKGLDDTICEKLVNYYLDRFREDPSKHDKVEFDIIFSCYTFDLPERIEVLKQYGFSLEEIKEITDKLRYLTNNIINSKNGLWKKDSDKIKILEEKRQTIMNSDLDTVSKIYWLLEDCKRYGTLPFAGLARAGFIAVQMLKSLVNVGTLSEDDYNSFMLGLNTVSSTITFDFKNMRSSDFLEKYGHLRPGTYNINSKRYDEAPDLYFNWNEAYDECAVTTIEQNKSFKMSLEQLKIIRETMAEHGIKDDVLLYFDFIKEAIEGREYSKFIFTKCISDVLMLMGKLGKNRGVNIDDISFANIDIIRKLYSSELDEETVLKKSIEEGKERYEETSSITMPPVILDSKDILKFYLPDTNPNFITLKNVSGKVCANLESKHNINDCILLIPAADPGYDWVFSYNIKGFITAYGGVNSHMAIRAGELQIPAVIGVGEKMFNKLKNCYSLEIDAAAKKVSVLE